MPKIIHQMSSRSHLSVYMQGRGAIQEKQQRIPKIFHKRKMFIIGQNRYWLLKCVVVAVEPRVFHSFKKHFLASAFLATKSFLTPVHVNVFILCKNRLASVTEAQESRRFDLGLLKSRIPVQTAALHNAVVINMSGFGVGAVRDDAGIIFRHLHFLQRQLPPEILGRAVTERAQRLRTSRLDPEIGRRFWRLRFRRRTIHLRNLNLQLGSQQSHPVYRLREFAIVSVQFLVDDGVD